MDAATRRVHGRMARRQGGRAGRAADVEAAVAKRHKQSASADKAHRLVEPGRKVFPAPPDMDLVADVRAAVGRPAVGQEGVSLAANPLDIEDKARPGLACPSAVFLGKGKAEGDDVPVTNVVLPSGGRGEDGAGIAKHVG